MSNGCAHCGAFIGQFYEYHAWEDQKSVCVFAIRIDENWRKVILEHDDYVEGWGVFLSETPVAQGAS